MGIIVKHAQMHSVTIRQHTKLLPKPRCASSLQPSRTQKQSVVAGGQAVHPRGGDFTAKTPCSTLVCCAVCQGGGRALREGRGPLLLLRLHREGDHPRRATAPCAALPCVCLYVCIPREPADRCCWWWFHPPLVRMSMAIRNGSGLTRTPSPLALLLLRMNSSLS